MNFKNKDAAKELNISSSYLRKLTEQGLINASLETPGGHRLYTEDDLEKAKEVLKPTVDKKELRLTKQIQNEKKRAELEEKERILSLRLWNEYGQFARNFYRFKMAVAHWVLLTPLSLWLIAASANADIPHIGRLAVVVCGIVGWYMPWSRLKYNRENLQEVISTWGAINHRRNYEPSITDILFHARFHRRYAEQRELAAQLYKTREEIKSLN